MPSSKLAAVALVLAAGGPVAAPSGAQDLAGAPQAYASDEAGLPMRHGHRHGRAGECYAQVRYPASYAPPPSGPEYVWTQAPAPPGAPGPVWCLTVQPFPQQPVQVSPARFGWVRVLCADDQTPERIARVQRGLYGRGLYRGEIDGRYDEETAGAVAAFQRERHIEHHGYLSYATLTALDVPPPQTIVIYQRRPTTFERGYVAWPGQTRYW